MPSPLPSARKILAISLTSSRRRQLFAIALDDSGFKTVSEALLKNIGVRIELEELGLFKPMSWP